MSAAAKHKRDYHVSSRRLADGRREWLTVIFPNGHAMRNVEPFIRGYGATAIASMRAAIAKAEGRA